MAKGRLGEMKIDQWTLFDFQKREKNRTLKKKWGKPSWTLGHYQQKSRKEIGIKIFLKNQWLKIS